MIGSFARAIANLFAPPLRGIVGLSFALAVASFAVLWAALAIGLAHSPHFGWRVLDWLLDSLGVLAALALSWLLFPAVVTMVMGFFLDRVAGAVEALDYPDRGPARHTPIIETLKTTSRLMG